MNFKDMLAKMSQLSEATKEVKGGKIHTADAGGYGRKVDASGDDDEPKKKRGGQEKDSGPKFDAPTKGDIFGRTSGEAPKGKEGRKVTPIKDGDSKDDGTGDEPKAKKGLKEYFDSLDKALNEADQIQIKPASQMPKQPGQTSLGAKPVQPGQPQQVAGQPQKNTQVIAQGNKTLGTVDNPQLAQQIKQSIGKGEMTLMPGEAMAEGEDEGKPGKNFAKIAKSAAKHYGSKAAGERVAGAVRAKLMKAGKIKEAEIPSHDGDEGANLGAGRSDAFLESAKPDFLDMDKDGNKKESFKKAVADKKKVKESMDNRLKAAHHEGRAHGLTGKPHCGKNYDDMEEARMYHEGYKQGLDECHGQMPIQGYVGENNTEVDDMASFGAHTPAMEDEFDEGNAFTRKLATTPAGGSFKLGGKSFTDNSGYDAKVFESWDNQLNSLLTEYNTIQEGLSVSISKGQEGAPDSVSVTAQDGEAEQLLQFIKQAGLGIFGGEEQAQVGTSSPMSVATDGEPAQTGANGIELDVVDDHDGMMDLIKKVTGGQAQSGPAQGFGDSGEDEHDHDHEHTDEETCNECGMMECECEADDKEQVDEVESEDQMEYEVAEDNAPDSGATDTNLEDQDDQEANASAAAYDQAQDEEQVEESFANSADDTFESDIDFMTKVISGGLNKQKSTGQTTIPVVASQLNRTVSESKMINESVSDWKKLAGIKS
jgi:hypothetical protein